MKSRTTSRGRPRPAGPGRSQARDETRAEAREPEATSNTTPADGSSPVGRGHADEGDAGGRWPGGWPAAVGAIAAAVAACVAVITLIVPAVDAGPDGNKLRAVFSTLHEGERVPWPTAPVSGTLSGLTKGKRLWLVQFKDGEHGVHPADERCEVGPGTWACGQLYIGTGDRWEKGAHFTVQLLAVDIGGAADDTFEKYDAKLENYQPIAMPPDVEVIASVRVVAR